MKAYGKTLCASVLVVAVASSGLAGCARNQAAPAPDRNGQVQTRNFAPAATPMNRADAGTVASHLEDLAMRIRGVKGANCVVFGKYAIVGIDVDPTMERSRVGTVKYGVAEAFRKDPYGINAIVTADVDLAQRLREIRADVRNGRPVAGFAEEMSDIVGRLVPQIPRNIVPPPAPENTGAPNAQVRGR
ncbi:YhcN/YlaJ family sporulation lipoprotein [Cohnella sp. CFH 77786]|uniref:YhcN/YlaJ family sporulation lipoprotein n=1 Tax=Cohnella sp. CFH 77786 TaxID=2662265 RepID=UPI001C60EDB1|nr:YhcN/YlaJ family sporulation lipoprotein [Cohnella sp. CFH 77786]MBW5444851.1 YhcN/YlaJ family sporulation lipoprotein [Cohnella sp. CFH 77786]